MRGAYVVLTILAATCNGLAATANILGLEYVKKQADTMRVPRSWNLPLGLLLAAGALGLLAGFAVPVLGTLAAAGLVLYFAGAFVAHLRARNYEFGAWAVYFAVAVGALVTSLLHHGPW